jgi:protein phosphatase
MQRTRNSLEITWPYGIDDQQSLNGNRLLTAVRLANRRLWKHADQHEEHIGMGTTIVAAIVEDDRLTVCSAGDSRAYLLRNGDMRQLTTDDSWAQMALAAGIIDEEKVSKHPMRNMITAAVGATESIQAQILEESLQPRDVCLLCSDGLHKLLSDEEMRAAIEASAGNLEDATEALARAAEVAGIDDDVSAVLLRYDTNT